MEKLARHVEAYSVIRLTDGRLAVWEPKGRLAITEWGKMGVKLPGDAMIEIVKCPTQLAADYLTANS